MAHDPNVGFTALVVFGGIGAIVGTLFWSIAFISSESPRRFLKTTLTYIFGVVAFFVSLMAAYATLRIAVHAFFGV